MERESDKGVKVKAQQLAHVFYAIGRILGVEPDEASNVALAARNAQIAMNSSDDSGPKAVNEAMERLYMYLDQIYDR